MKKIENPFQLLLDEISGIKAQIADLKKSHPQTPEMPPSEVFLTQKQTCELLGVSNPTLWAWTKHGIIKSYKIGTLNRYKKSEILASPKLIIH
jgi:excisionase family DNA binding protein